MREKKEYVFYKKNVDYFVGVRMKPNDPTGVLLTYNRPDVAVDVDELRNFKIANQSAILEGKIIPIDEPDLNWETPNAVTDEEIDDLLKVWMKLKAKLPTLTSLPIIQKMLNIAKEQNKSPKVLNMIQERINELSEDVDDLTQRGGVE